MRGSLLVVASLQFVKDCKFRNSLPTAGKKRLSINKHSEQVDGNVLRQLREFFSPQLIQMNLITKTAQHLMLLPFINLLIIPSMYLLKSY